MLRTQKCYRCR